MRADTFKTVMVALAAGVDQVVLAADPAKRREVKAVQVCADANTRVELHFGPTLSATNGIGVGYVPANGGSNVAFNGHGPQSAFNEALLVDIIGAANARIYVTYEEA